MMRQCEYCYSVADWCAETARGPRDVCQVHYDEIVAERRADSLSRIPAALLPLLTR